MGKIFCLMGKSSSGKDTIFKRLRANKALGLAPVATYTTRPMRQNETDGVEYFFINEDRLKEYEAEDKVIEQRVYHTVFGDWYYSTIDDGQIKLDEANYLLIVTLEAYNNLKRYFGSENVVPLYIAVEDGIRLERAIEREKREVTPNFNEVCRRFLADNADFSDEKLKDSGVEKYYFNVELEECVEEITQEILELK
ncbi:nucleoside/nucleotide kinase family protein [Cellulosilyticum ruminicola]|uniref:guanylate kinase n=1 Tax=Cellulosilyticum ruminicola TaxID=425254 RepID=UPI0006CFB5EC|nr:guanylate kinase [Cellulosilyticum ruminicola]